MVPGTLLSTSPKAVNGCASRQGCFRVGVGINVDSGWGLVEDEVGRSEVVEVRSFLRLDQLL